MVITQKFCLVLLLQFLFSAAGTAQIYDISVPHEGNTEKINEMRCREKVKTVNLYSIKIAGSKPAADSTLIESVTYDTMCHVTEYRRNELTTKSYYWKNKLQREISYYDNKSVPGQFRYRDSLRAEFDQQNRLKYQITWKEFGSDIVISRYENTKDGKIIRRDSSNNGITCTFILDSNYTCHETHMFVPAKNVTLSDYYTFDTKGNLLMVVSKRFRKNSDLPYAQDISQKVYDVNGKKIDVRGFHIENKDTVVKTRDWYGEYNKQQSPTIVYNESDGTKTITARLDYEPDGRLKSITEYSVSGEANRKYEFKDSCLVSILMTEKGKMAPRHKFNYDSNGNCTEKYSFDTGSGETIQYSQYTYNEHRLISSISSYHYSADANGKSNPVLNKKVVYHYTYFGK